MEIHDLADQKIIEIWLTNAETSNPTFLRRQLQPLYHRHKSQGYRVVVFHSGQRDLHDVTRDLLLYNRIPKRDTHCR